MLRKITIELDVLPISELEITENSQWVWATNVKNSYFGWDRIRIWKSTFGIRWSFNSSDISFDKSEPIPYTHYTVLPRIEE